MNWIVLTGSMCLDKSCMSYGITILVDDMVTQL